ncbi:MAG TPA: RNA polymerase sigma factor, partial [Myxococcales bacterium]|nr:RNA polymerase sigma factor [Myxococcales bacterium]
MIAGARRLLGHNRDEALVAGVRRRDRRAFEAIYERHAAQLLTFCIYLLGSRHDAEDALQATFASAYRALLNDSRPVSLRPWLFTIARNESLSILRKRRPQVELNGEVALTGDPVKLAEVHEEMVSMIGGIRELPEKQRAALVLAEVHGMSHADIGSVLGVRPDQVKAYVFQARSNLLSDRHAREVDCREIREELATEHGRVRTRARLRRHLRSCDGCRAYANGVEHQQRQLASLLPILPAVTLRYRAIDQALGLCGSDVANYANSATMAGTALEVAGGGMTALAAKVATGIVAVGA